MDVIETLRCHAAQDHEALRARGVMIDILEETVARLRVAGFAPSLDLAFDALVVLRLDTSAWALRQVGLPARVLEREPGSAIPAVAVPDPAPRLAPPGPVGFWTPERDSQLLDLRKAGKTAGEIAAEFGLSRVGAVHDRIYKLKKAGIEVPDAVQHPRKAFGAERVTVRGVLLREWTEADDAVLIAEYAGTKPLSQVASDLDRSLSALNKRIAVLREQGRIKDLRPRGTLVRKIVKAAPVSEPEREAKAEDVPIVPAPVPLPVGAPVQEQKSEPVSPPQPFVDRKVPRTAGGIELGKPRTARVERPDPVSLIGLTSAQKADVIAQHVFGLPAHAEFDAELDLELCEAVFSNKGGLALFATNLGIDQRIALARFDTIVAPFRTGGGKALPIEAAGLILPALRARVAKARGVAA